MSEPLSRDDLDCLMRGACFLGSGGGGRLDIAQRIRDKILGGSPVTAENLRDVPDDAFMCFVAGVGAPSGESTFCQSSLKSFRALEGEMQKEKGKDFHFQYVIPGETGAVNSVLPLLVPAQIGDSVRLVNADGGGRAFPLLEMCTFALDPTPIPCNPAAVANEDPNVPAVIFNPSTPQNLEQQIGSDPRFSHEAALATFVMNGKQAKAPGRSVDSAPRTAIEVGEALLLPSQECRIARIEQLFRKKGRWVFTLGDGNFTHLEPKQGKSCDVGTLTFIGTGWPEACSLEIDFVNENLATRLHLGSEVYDWMAPWMFCYLSPAGDPLSNADVASEWKGEKIPITLLAISPARESSTKQERTYFRNLYDKYFPEPPHPCGEEPDWDVMMAHAADMKCDVRLSRPG